MTKSIRFIDSQYHDLFRIPDGGVIQVNYPDRSFAAKCEYVDDYHLRVGMELFHICQFAEILEQSGGSCQPEPHNDLKEAAWDMGHRGFLAIQSCESGWDYTCYDKEMHVLDGGVFEVPEISLQEARNAIAKDIGWDKRTMTQLNYAVFMDEVGEKEAKELKDARVSAIQRLRRLKQEPIVSANESRKQTVER